MCLKQFVQLSQQLEVLIGVIELESQHLQICMCLEPPAAGELDPGFLQCLMSASIPRLVAIRSNGTCFCGHSASPLSWSPFASLSQGPFFLSLGLI